MVLAKVIALAALAILALLFYGASLEVMTGANAIDYAVGGAFVIIGYLVLKG